MMYPPNIHFPTGILPNSLVERATPVNAPNGENNKERPKPPSVNPSRYLIPGMAATHVPNKRLEDENKKPMASTGLSFIKDEIFLIMTKQKRRKIF